ncbi:unnamed protein product [Pedinophyceae sp. YPF-701]|nr:unnamed protein product [Pedinophyceae sp. YPF-701]
MPRVTVYPPGGLPRAPRGLLGPRDARCVSVHAGGRSLDVNTCVHGAWLSCIDPRMRLAAAARAALRTCPARLQARFQTSGSAGRRISRITPLFPRSVGRRMPVGYLPSSSSEASLPGSDDDASASEEESPIVVDVKSPALIEKATRIRKQLAELYPPPVPIPLDHKSDFQLLVAVILSAQSTDKKVNEVTPALFEAAPDAPSMAKLSPDEVKEYIKQVGLAPTKAKNIANMARILVEKHGGKVPNDHEALKKLPGVGQKTASVVMAQAFGVPSFPVDTHIHRLAQRWGLSVGPTVDHTEANLRALMPRDTWNDLHLQIIYFGREHCPAKSHDPAGCPICSWAAVPPYNRAGVSPLKAGESLKSRPDLARRIRAASPAGMIEKTKRAKKAIEDAGPAAKPASGGKRKPAGGKGASPGGKRGPAKAAPPEAKAKRRKSGGDDFDDLIG